MFISCLDYNEYLNKNSCNHNCNNCFGNKNVYECIKDFYVTGETVLDKVLIKKGDWYWIRFINDDHVLLENGTECFLRLKRELFDKYFTGEIKIKRSINIIE